MPTEKPLSFSVLKVCTHKFIVSKYSRVSFCDGSFYDDSLLRSLSSRTEQSRLVVHQCRSSSVLSLRSALPVLCQCACVSYFSTRVETLIVTTIYLQLIQNRYMFRSFTGLHCSHQHCVQPVASDVEVVGYL